MSGERGGSPTPSVMQLLSLVLPLPLVTARQKKGKKKIVAPAVEITGVLDDKCTKKSSVTNWGEKMN